MTRWAYFTCSNPTLSAAPACGDQVGRQPGQPHRHNLHWDALRKEIPEFTARQDVEVRFVRPILVFGAPQGPPEHSCGKVVQQRQTRVVFYRERAAGCCDKECLANAANLLGERRL